MKEFNAQTGGRYVYVDDMLNLQELALAFGELFNECDNFIVSGCQVSGNAISAGYVYLNGKLRRFSGASGISTWPQYLYESNVTESVQYAVGGTKVGRNVYGVSIGATVPTSLDPLTQQVPVSMQITQSGGKRIRDAFFARYAVILDSANQMQTVNGSLKLTGELEVTGGIKSVSSRFTLSHPAVQYDVYAATGVLNMESVFASGKKYKLTVQDDSGFSFYINDALAATITSTGINSSKTIQSTTGIFGNIGMNANNLYNRTDLSNTASVDINMIGYGGATSYYRNTRIGNGKGTAIVTVNGQTKAVSIDGTTTLVSHSNEGLILMSDKAKSNTLQNSIIWKDANQEVIGFAGFSETNDMTFRITNNLSAIYVYGATGSFVDLGPEIRENGISLKDKYVTSSSFTESLKTKANTEDVYTKTKADETFLKTASGLTGFAGKFTNEQLRTQIGAIGSNELQQYAKLDQFLQDMASSEAAKQKIRNNIGAAAVGDFQAKLKDTGWINLMSGLYIRQIGNIVSIQGKITTKHSGTLFSIPNTIDPPTYGVHKTFAFSNSLSWTVGIAAKTRQCVIKYCNGSCYKTTEFSLTYMV